MSRNRKVGSFLAPVSRRIEARIPTPPYSRVLALGFFPRPRVTRCYFAWDAWDALIVLVGVTAMVAIAFGRIRR